MRPHSENSADRKVRDGISVFARIAAGMAICVAVLHPARAPAAGLELASETAPTCVRIGIAPGTWGGVNRKDAQAAIKTWAKTIVGQRSIALEVETQLYESDAEMTTALRSGKVDAVSMLSDQLLGLEPKMVKRPIACLDPTRRLLEEYRRLNPLPAERAP